MLRIVADENIPLAGEAFGSLGEIRLLPGHAITAAAVRAADVLLVRSVTRVDGALIAGSRLRFVGSATIGTDHVDVAALAAARIPFHYAPGSNAESVVEYVLAALLSLAARRGVALRGTTIGVVGCGAIGSRLVARLPALGMRVLANDPPLAAAAERQDAPHAFAPLAQVLAEADVITLHVPLTTAGPFPTRHLVDAAELRRMRPAAWLVNTSRGAVVANGALRASLESGVPGAVVLDVWEGEPEPDPELIAHCALATPHIAGYSYDGKVAGTLMMYDALVRELGIASTWDGSAALEMSARASAVLRPSAWTPGADAVAEARWLHALVRQVCDIEADDARMRTLLTLPAGDRARGFQELRRSYPRRRSFSRYVLPENEIPAPLQRAVREGLRIRPD